MTIYYTEWQTLQARGPIAPAPSEPIEGILLVGTKAALHFYGNGSQYGDDLIEIFPAVHNGNRCWIKREEWCPSEDYSASGTQESIIPFEEGVQLFLTRGVFEFAVPDELEAPEDSVSMPAMRESGNHSDGEEYEDRGIPHQPSARVLTQRETVSKRSPRPPRGSR